MAAIRSLSSISDKWARVTPQRAAEYLSGVQNPKKKWDERAIAAKETHKTAMADAARRDAYAKGIAEAGFSKWQKNAIQKGPGRFSEGVQIAKPDYSKGFAKYRDVIDRVVLPPRYPKGDIRNLERVKAIALALRAAKVGT